MMGETVFDLSSVSAAMNTLRVRKLAALVGGVIFSLVFASIFVFLFGPGIVSGHTTLYKEVVLTIVVVFAIAMGIQGITGLRSVRKGPASLQLEREGLVFRFPKRVLVAKWADPRLELDLYDATNCDSNYVRVTPYSVFLNGENYGLTREAFETILSTARRHGLVEQTSIASHWVYAPVATPIVHRFSLPKEAPGVSATQTVS